MRFIGGKRLLGGLVIVGTVATVGVDGDGFKTTGRHGCCGNNVVVDVEVVAVGAKLKMVGVGLPTGIGMNCGCKLAGNTP